VGDLLAAGALVLVIEGLMYAAAPDAVRRMMGAALQMPKDTLRLGGLVAAAAGVVLLWLVRG
jgi:uncharacterized protein YjeT (DUF2065 family)